MNVLRRYLVLPIFVALLVTGCTAVVGDEVDVAALPTLTPSPVMTVTPALGAGGQPGYPNQPLTPTITLTPAQATQALGPTSTLNPAAFPTINPNLPTTVAPTVSYFVATPEHAREGEPVMLIWTTEGGTDAAVYRLNADSTPGQTWVVDLEGSLTVTPRDGFSMETYVLAVTNGVATVEQSLTFDVLCGRTWFFQPQPEDLCPTADPLRANAVMQEFEHGRMIRLASTGEIVVLFDDFPTSAGAQNPAWLRVADPYTEGALVEDPSIEPPPGLVEPERGFGMIWRDTPGVRDRLGWAVGPEQPYTSTQQTTQTPLGEQIFFTDPLDQVITLIPAQQGWLVAGFVD
jgi:hypothetical protein